MSKARKKIAEWANRYGPAEVVGTLTAVFGAALIHKWIDNIVVAAYVGATCETIGYYSVMIRQEFRRYAHKHPLHITKNLLLEFGPAELMDSFVSRPFFMGFGMHYFGTGLGLIGGKLAADFVFYIPAVIVYELRKK